MRKTHIRLRVYWLSFVLLIVSGTLYAQADPHAKNPAFPVVDSLQPHHSSDSLPVKDSIHLPAPDTSLYITNLNPYFTLHVDSTINYNLDINKDSSKFYWYIRNAPVGLKINKDNGMLSFRAEKSYFLSGRLKYDQEYKVALGVQNLANAKEKVDTFFTILFYNTEIIASTLKPGVEGTVYLDEGDTLNIPVQCEMGSFPIETVTTLVDIPLKNYEPVKKCDDVFRWPIPFDFIKDADREKTRSFNIRLIGADKFYNRDTATIKVVVRDATNYPFMVLEHNKVARDIQFYILQLKFSFKQLDKNVRGTKNTRTSFDLASGSSALAGTIFSSAGTSESAKQMGKIMPSVGVALVPVKEAVSPNKAHEQNSAAQIRTSIKRLEYSLTENGLSGERDIDILNKVFKLRSDMKQVQVSLIDVPMVDTGNLSEEELNKYFNSPKVNKKYKLKK